MHSVPYTINIRRELYTIYYYYIPYTIYYIKILILRWSFGPLPVGAWTPKADPALLFVSGLKYGPLLGTGYATGLHMCIHRFVIYIYIYIYMYIYMCYVNKLYIHTVGLCMYTEHKRV